MQRYCPNSAEKIANSVPESGPVYPKQRVSQLARKRAKLYEYPILNWG